MAKSRIERRRAKKNRIFKILKFLFTFCFVLFLFAVGTFTYFAMKVDKVADESPEHVSEKRENEVNPREDPISILFLGVDDRDGNLEGRTDAMILATFNKNEKTIKMISIPRDSLVEIPGRPNRDKINHAHAFGGIPLTIQTVENLLDIPIDYYIKLNFTAFVEIIDALGGIEIDVPFTFSEMDSKDQKNAITLHEGLQTLNGEEALAYARMRKNDPRGDIGRGERQQEIIKAVIKKGATLSSITKYDDVFESLENHLMTNLTFRDMLSLHSYSPSLRNIETLSFVGYDTMINGIYYYDLDEDSIRSISQQFKEHLELTDTTFE